MMNDGPNVYYLGDIEMSQLSATLHPSASNFEERERLAHAAHALHDGKKIERAVTIRKRPEEIYAYWRDFSNLPRFMTRLKSIEVRSPTRSKWIWNAAPGINVDWEAEIIAEIENRMLSWQSTPESLIQNAGSVWFLPSPHDGSTEVRFQVMYLTPGGRVVETITKLFGSEPGEVLVGDLKRLRSIMETGELPTILGQSHGARSFIN